LIVSAAAPEHFPPEDLPEVAFLGRSNVGKSSLLNSLVDRRGLAFTSSRPGCTQVINFYRVGGNVNFVDLPGYGYAKVPRDKQLGWKRLIEAYLERRSTLALCVLLLDARRGWMEKDLELKQWLEFHNRRYVVVATKVDKLKSQKEQSKGMSAVREFAAGTEPLPFSAVTGQGVRAIWQTISKIHNP
jgi:GTP-binding protein